MSDYPYVLSERDTLEAARLGMSIARYGDGELRICCGSKSISQCADPRLTDELRGILTKPGPHVLPCIPNIGPGATTPRTKFWSEYLRPQFTKHYADALTYGSSFITRPDNAPWIDRPDYWQEVRKLWQGKSVAYVSGDETLLRVLRGDVWGLKIFDAPRRDAFAELDQLTGALLQRPYGVVIIALGAAGTALAARLGRYGAQHALDLGHIGQFMENPGAFSHSLDELASPEYRALLKQSHATHHWGKSGHSWADKVVDFAREIGAEQVLDYGCGSGTLKPALGGLLKCAEYDPGIIGKDIPPKLADLVVSTDVLEHVEPDRVDVVLHHIFAVARKGAFLAIAKKPAKHILGDGRNAHLSCHDDDFWFEHIRASGWSDVRLVETAWKKCLIVCRK